MNNVVSLQRPVRAAFEPAIPALITLFATRRRGRQDAFWLKENAELLQILAALGAGRDMDLAPLQRHVSGLLEELVFFPQYYRMFLSIALDLRALGVPNVPVEAMVKVIRRDRLYDIELSDTHRGEALLLLRRAGDHWASDLALESRLSRFACNSAAFCLPNRRAAYDLTHIVFHSADYGRRTIGRDANRRLSLIHAGMVAWLENNLDLLAEVTIALRLSGEEVPADWADAVARGAGSVSFEAAGLQTSFDDDYHQYLVLNWALGLSGAAAFRDGVPAQASLVRQPPRQGSALRDLSVALLEMGTGRVADWGRMRWRLWGHLSDDARARVAVLEAMPEFEGFFAGFARARHGTGQV